MKNFYKNKKILITGHTGFKGAWLTQTLINWGAQVVGVALPPATKPSLFESLGLEKQITHYTADICNLDRMKSIFEDEKPEIVFHLAAQAIVRTSYDDPVETFSVNCMGSANVLEAIRMTPSVKAAVIITTDKVYENKEWHYAYRENDPLGGYDPYSASKAAADIITQSFLQSFFNPQDFGRRHGTLVAIARAGNVIGGGDWADYRLIPDVIRATYHAGKEVMIRNPHSIRPWQHVLEPLAGYLMLGKRLYDGETAFAQAWNFGPHNDSFMSVEEVLKESKKNISNISYNIVPDPSKHEAALLKLDINKAVHMLGWRPTMGFPETIKATLLWYGAYYEKPEDIVEFTNTQINNFFK